MNGARVRPGRQGFEIVEAAILVDEKPIPTGEHRHRTIVRGNLVGDLERYHDQVHIDGVLKQDTSLEEATQGGRLDEAEDDRANLVQPAAIAQPPVGIGREDQQVGIRPLVGGQFGASP